LGMSRTSNSSSVIQSRTRPPTTSSLDQGDPVFPAFQNTSGERHDDISELDPTGTRHLETKNHTYVTVDINTTQWSTADFIADALRDRKRQETALLFQTGSVFPHNASGNNEILPSDSAAASPYQSYPSTILLIVLVHLIWVYQWNRKWRRRKTLTSYHALVQKKYWYQWWIALLSHPPVTDLETNESLERTREGLSTTQRTNNVPVLVFASSGVRQVVAFTGVAFVNGELSGITLLVYNSHVLWSCRALETLYNDFAGQYICVWIALAWLGVLLELFLNSLLLRMTSNVVEVAETNLESSRSVHQVLTYRTMGTLTVLMAALLVLFRIDFPNVPVQVLPFFGNPFFLMEPSVTYFVAVGILTTLSMGRHAITSVTFGTLVGSLWSAGLLEFLAEPYWAAWMVLQLALVTLLSLYEEYSNYVPCVDGVAWFEDGSSADLFGASSNRDDAFLRDASDRAAIELGGLLPEHNDLDMDEDTDRSLAERTPIFRRAQSTVRSRRMGSTPDV
jgi:hypothetical protein